MKRLGITILGSAFAVAGSLLFGAGIVGSGAIAEAAPGADNVTISSQQMLPDGTDQATISWVSYNQGTQFVDISTDGNFFPGNFMSSGPLTNDQNSFVWNGLQSQVTYFVRVNTLTPYGWITSAPVNFTLQGFGYTAPYGYFNGNGNGYFNGNTNPYDPYFNYNPGFYQQPSGPTPMFPPTLNQPAPVQAYPYYAGN